MKQADVETRKGGEVKKNQTTNKTNWTNEHEYKILPLKIILRMVVCVWAMVIFSGCGKTGQTAANIQPDNTGTGAAPTNIQPENITPTSTRISPSPTFNLSDTATPAQEQASPTPAAALLTPAVQPASPQPTVTPSAEPVTTTLLFTGVIVPARCLQASLDRTGDYDYPYDEVRSILQGADLAVGVFNTAISDRVEHTGCTRTYQLVGSPKNAPALSRAGFDLMSVATNHIKDCGLNKGWCDFAFFDTLEALRNAGMQTVGAGADLDEALQPIIVTIHGVRFGFVSLGNSKMDESVFAGEGHPGIAHLSEENMRRAIEAAHAQADVVIALPHWGSEDNTVPSWNQRTQAAYTVAAGADLVVGNHTHVVQGLHTIEGAPVFYGLGNFMFEQELRDHRQAVILLVYFRGTEYVGYKLIPTVHDRDGRIHLAEGQEAVDILQRIEAASAGLK